MNALLFPAPGLHLMKSLLPSQASLNSHLLLEACPGPSPHVTCPFSTSSAFNTWVSNSPCHSLPSDLWTCIYISELCRPLALYLWARPLSRSHFPHLGNGISNSACLRGLLRESTELKQIKWCKLPSTYEWSIIVLYDDNDGFSILTYKPQPSRPCFNLGIPWYLMPHGEPSEKQTNE